LFNTREKGNGAKPNTRKKSAPVNRDDQRNQKQFTRAPRALLKKNYREHSSLPRNYFTRAVSARVQFKSQNGRDCSTQLERASIGVAKSTRDSNKF
jgi:hypothetical protein